MKKHWLYLRYLLRHKWFVFMAGRKTRVSLWRLIIHDWSKFLPCEWFPYVEYFYGEKPRLQKMEWDDCRYWELVQPYLEGFDRAWLHHQHLNPHHWQHWVLREDSGEVKLLPIPEHVIREMVADWAGAGRAITGKWELGAWYSKNRDRQLIEQSSKNLVTALVDTYWPDQTMLAAKLTRRQS